MSQEGEIIIEPTLERKRPGADFAGFLALDTLARQIGEARGVSRIVSVFSGEVSQEQRNQSWLEIKGKLNLHIEEFRKRGVEQSPDDYVSYAHEAESLAYCLGQIEAALKKQESVAVSIHNRPWQESERTEGTGNNLTSSQEIIHTCRGQEVSFEAAQKKGLIGSDSVDFPGLLLKPQGENLSRISNPHNSLYPSEAFFSPDGNDYRTTFFVLRDLPGTAVIVLERKAAKGEDYCPVKAHFLSYALR